MEEIHTMELTAFDSLITDSNLQMIKAAIPYIPANGQGFISMYVKFIELSNTINIFQKKDKDSLGICSLPEDKRNVSDMLNTMKHHCSGQQKERFESIINIISTFQMFQTFQDEVSKMNQDQDSPLPKIDPMNTLKGMLTPEQQSMLETYSALLSN
ncbi:MAG: hypothetical protein GX913_05625 [Clostridiales bacterium]|nr:hypothetical protein [Clostridiales bacterium]